MMQANMQCGALVAGTAATAVAMSAGFKTQARAADGLAAMSTLAAVIVTAHKRVENINDVPESLTASSGEKLDVIRSSGGDIRVLSASVPSLYQSPLRLTLGIPVRWEA